MKETVIGLLMLMCLVLGYFLGTVKLNKTISIPKKPSSVSTSSFWLGGNEGGEWIECNYLRNQDYKVTVFADVSGYVCFSGLMQLEFPRALSEQDIRTYSRYYNEDDDGAYIVLSVPCKLRGKWSNPGTTKDGKSSVDFKKAE